MPTLKILKNWGRLQLGGDCCIYCLAQFVWSTWFPTCKKRYRAGLHENWFSCWLLSCQEPLSAYDSSCYIGCNMMCRGSYISFFYGNYKNTYCFNRSVVIKVNSSPLVSFFVFVGMCVTFFLLTWFYSSKSYIESYKWISVSKVNVTLLVLRLFLSLTAVPCLQIGELQI